MTHAVTGHRESRAGAAGKTAVNGNLRLGWGKITAESETFKGGGRLFAHSSSCKCNKKLAELTLFSSVKRARVAQKTGYTVLGTPRYAWVPARLHRPKLEAMCRIGFQAQVRALPPASTPDSWCLVPAPR